jgi:hypothetical protein
MEAGGGAVSRGMIFGTPNPQFYGVREPYCYLARTGYKMQEA